MKGKSLVLTSMLVISLGVRAIQTAAQEKIEKCGPITSPGSYVLTKNLKAIGDCLKVEADFVTIDLNRFLIEVIPVRGGSPGVGILDIEISGVDVPRDGVTVRNGTIKGFLRGISLFGDFVRIEGVRVLDSVQGGILVCGVPAIVRDSIIGRSGSFGISTRAGSLVVGNVGASNHSTGIDAGEGSTLVNNASLGNTEDSISVRCPGVVLSNTVAFNSPDISPVGDNCTTAHNAPLP
jgi:hypothetical protein